MSSTAIPSTVNQCFDAFDSLWQAAESPSELSLALQEERGRFKVWTANISAHRAVTSRRSLEYRLRDSSNLRDTVRFLLQDLLQALQAQADVASSSHDLDSAVEAKGDAFVDEDDDFDFGTGAFTSEDEEQRLLEDIHDVVNCLMRFSMTLRNPARHDHMRYSATSNAHHYEPFDREHVRSKYPEAPDYLVDRLGKSISRHRLYFDYREQHHAKLAEGLEHRVDQGEGTVHEQASTIATSVHKDIERAPRVHDSDDDSVYTATSFASSASGQRTLRPPPLPAEGENGDPFECKICFTMVIADNERAWRQHVYEDLPPYVCMQESCATAHQPYARRREWQQHERDMHHRAWACPFCKDVLATLELFQAHVVDSHNQERDDSNMQRVIDACAQPLENELTTSQCPLCQKKIVSQKRFFEHLGHHLEELALFSLPSHLHGDESDAGFDGSDASDIPQAVIDVQREIDRVEKQIDSGTMVWADRNLALNELSELKRLQEANNDLIAAATLRDHGGESGEEKSDDDSMEEALKTILFIDAAGRKFRFAWRKCKTWEGMELLIKQAFMPVPRDFLSEHVHKGHYDLIGSDGQIMLPQLWDTIIRPGEEVKMHMWSFSEDVVNAGSQHEATHSPRLSEHDLAVSESAREKRQQGQEYPDNEHERGMDDRLEAPIKLNDALGRTLTFPWQISKTWKGMASLIEQAFMPVADGPLSEHVRKGHYDLTGPNDQIILPQAWESVIQPGWQINMYMLSPEEQKDLNHNHRVADGIFRRDRTQTPASAAEVLFGAARSQAQKEQVSDHTSEVSEPREAIDTKTGRDAFEQLPQSSRYGSAVSESAHEKLPWAQVYQEATQADHSAHPSLFATSGQAVDTDAAEMRRQDVPFSDEADVIEYVAGGTKGSFVSLPSEAKRRPVYPRVARKYLDVETLKYYNLPYEIDHDYPEYIIIRHEMNQDETDALFEHTARLRSGDIVRSSDDTSLGEKKKDERQPVFPKVHRRYLDVETLQFYGIPFERDRVHPDYFILLRQMDKHETEILFEHTRKLRSAAGLDLISKDASPFDAEGQRVTLEKKSMLEERELPERRRGKEDTDALSTLGPFRSTPSSLMGRAPLQPSSPIEREGEEHAIAMLREREPAARRQRDHGLEFRGRTTSEEEPEAAITRDATITPETLARGRASAALPAETRGSRDIQKIAVGDTPTEPHRTSSEQEQHPPHHRIHTPNVVYGRSASAERLRQLEGWSMGSNELSSGPSVDDLAMTSQHASKKVQTLSSTTAAGVGGAAEGGELEKIERDFFGDVDFEGEDSEDDDGGVPITREGALNATQQIEQAPTEDVNQQSASSPLARMSDVSEDAQGEHSSSVEKQMMEPSSAQQEREHLPKDQYIEPMLLDEIQKLEDREAQDRVEAHHARSMPPGKKMKDLEDKAAKTKPMPDTLKAPIKFKDPVGRKFSFPWHMCKTWKGMESLIKQACLHVGGISEHVYQGHYDLTGPDGGIILPQVWDTIVQPGWEINMHMWPMPEGSKQKLEDQLYSFEDPLAGFPAGPSGTLDHDRPAKKKARAKGSKELTGLAAWIAGGSRKERRWP
ncbi:hypothetical protein LTR17_020324 [Elasticomyces elasticus]|nr:hypothetical protein LTR17_020324 [Elasticomyces elasticus]